MARIITSEKILRQYLPNVITNVDDETPLYEKLLPFIELSESWITDNIIGVPMLGAIADGLHDSTFAHAAMAVVSKSFALAVPSLDLVLTPNGFGVVSNNTIAPASKDRVDRLVSSLFRTEFFCLQQLVEDLKRCDIWHSGDQCKWFAESIIQELSIVSHNSDDNNLMWDDFISFREKAFPFEQEIANGWLSPLLMSRLRNCVVTATYSANERTLAKIVINVVCAAVASGELNYKLLDDVVSFIRLRPDDFQDWHNSDTAKLFTPPTFVNDKDSGGYFF